MKISTIKRGPRTKRLQAKREQSADYASQRLYVEQICIAEHISVVVMEDGNLMQVPNQAGLNYIH